MSVQIVWLDSVSNNLILLNASAVPVNKGLAPLVGVAKNTIGATGAVASRTNIGMVRLLDLLDPLSVIDSKQPEYVPSVGMVRVVVAVPEYTGIGVAVRVLQLAAPVIETSIPLANHAPVAKLFSLTTNV